MSDEITPNIQTSQTDPISEPIETTIPSEPEVTVIEPESTAQIPVIEPLTESTNSEPEIEQTTPEELLSFALLPEKKPLASSELEPIKTETEQEKEIPETKSKSKPETKSKPEPEKPKVIPVIIPKKNLARELLIKARNAIQSRKRKKLDKVMSLFLKHSKITNDEIEKLLHVSDATATRYLSQLEKEGKIKQMGKTGKSVFYSKI
jgi:predicted HTH transcriptional regulator